MTVKRHPVLRRLEVLSDRRSVLEEKLDAVRDQIAECFVEGKGEVPVKTMAKAAKLTRENVYYWLRKD